MYVCRYAVPTYIQITDPQPCSPLRKLEFRKVPHVRGQWTVDRQRQARQDSTQSEGQRICLHSHLRACIPPAINTVASRIPDWDSCLDAKFAIPHPVRMLHKLSLVRPSRLSLHSSSATCQPANLPTLAPHRRGQAQAQAQLLTITNIQFACSGTPGRYRDDKPPPVLQPAINVVIAPPNNRKSIPSDRVPIHTQTHHQTDIGLVLSRIIIPGNTYT